MITKFTLARTIGGCECFACYGIIKHADNQSAIFHQGNAYHKVGYTLNEFFGIIQRFHHPYKFFGKSFLGIYCFFREPTVPWLCFG